MYMVLRMCTYIQACQLCVLLRVTCLASETLFSCLCHPHPPLEQGATLDWYALKSSSFLRPTKENSQVPPPQAPKEVQLKIQTALAWNSFLTDSLEVICCFSSGVPTLVLAIGFLPYVIMFPESAALIEETRLRNHRSVPGWVQGSGRRA